MKEQLEQYMYKYVMNDSLNPLLEYMNLIEPTEENKHAFLQVIEDYPIEILYRYFIKKFHPIITEEERIRYCRDYMKRFGEKALESLKELEEEK